MKDSNTAAVAELAARWVVEEGMEYGPAKRKAAQTLGRQQGRMGALPSNESVEEQVREHLALFHAETQASELLALRRLALPWMEKLAAFRPHLSGAAWRGTATRLSNLVFDLYCDDTKAAEIAFLNFRGDFDQRGNGPDEPTVLATTARTAAWPEPVTLVFFLLDADELRGALKPDSQGRSWRGDLRALKRLLDEESPS